MTVHPTASIHPSAIVDAGASIGAGVKIWHFSHVMAGAIIGPNSSLGQNSFVANGVTIGSGVRIQNNVSIYEGVTLEDKVFCGPSCVFTNISIPRSAYPKKEQYEPTLVKKGASLGANATIVCGSTIGAWALIAAGAVVPKGVVPDHALMQGVPAKRVGWVSRHGHKLPPPDRTGFTICPQSGWRYQQVAPDILICLDDPEDPTEPTPTSVKEQPKEKTISMLDLAAQSRSLEQPLTDAFLRVLHSGQFIGGAEVSSFESEIAAYCGVPHAISLSSGTDALLVSLMALDIGPGDEVITTPYTFVATAESILRVGATPRFVDIHPETLLLDERLVESAITQNTKAIVPVHLFGQMCDMRHLTALARQFRLFIIEDAAQALGASRDEFHAGGSGATGCFSFFPSKNLGALGDGGMIVTKNNAIADRVRQLRNHGQAPKYYSTRVGGNFRLDALQAAFLRAKLPYLSTWTDQRRKHRQLYSLLLLAAGVASPNPNADLPITLLASSDAEIHVANQYVILANRRDELRAHLLDHHIATEVYYPTPIHLQPAFEHLGHKHGAFPVAEQASTRALALPIDPALSEQSIHHITDLIVQFYRSSAE